MKIINKFIIEISSVFIFLIYFFSLAPGIVQIDSGELAAVASLLGIAHPTGYPLFTFLGFIFTKIAPFASKIYSLNVISSIYTSIGFYFIAKTIFLVLTELCATDRSDKLQKKKGKPKKSFEIRFDSEHLKFISIISAFIIGLSKTFYIQSTSVEVYSLHITLISASIYLFLKAYCQNKSNESKKSSEIKNLKPYLVFSFVFGLSFTNHMTTILLIPAFAYLFFTTFQLNKKLLFQLALMLIPFLIALSLYLYLPIRASQNPEINWGNPVTWENFKRHIMGWQYKSWIFKSTESASKQLKYFISIFPGEYAYFGLILIFLGAYFLFKINKKFFVFFSLLFFTCLFYSINYDINDIDSYFLLAFISSGMMIPFGLFEFLKKLTNVSLVRIIGVLLIATMFFINFPKVNQRENVEFHQYSREMLNSLEPNSIIISYLWDYFISPSLYLQFVENLRRDVVVIDKELVRRSWYFVQLKRNYPDVFLKSQELINGFLPELRKFERNENYNSQVLEKYYRDIISSFIIRNINQRPVYVTPEILVNEMKNQWLVLPDSLTVIPDLFAFRVIKKNESNNYVPLKKKSYEIKFRKVNDQYLNNLKNIVTMMHINRALYEYEFGQIVEAKRLILEAHKIDPNVQLPDDLYKLLIN